MTLLGGYVRWHIYTNPLYIPPFQKFLLTPIKGEHGPLCSLAIPVTVVAAMQDLSTGAKARERSDRAGGGCGPTVGRFF